MKRLCKTVVGADESNKDSHDIKNKISGVENAVEGNSYSTNGSNPNIIEAMGKQPKKQSRNVRAAIRQAYPQTSGNGS